MATTAHAEIETQVGDDGIAVLTLRRPEKRNALTIRMRDEITRTLTLGVARQIAEAPQRCLETTKRYLSGTQGLGFEESFRIEHDDVFDQLLRTRPPG